MEGTNARIGKKALRVVNMSPLPGNTPVTDPHANRSDKWVWRGKHNLFREFLRALADNCAPLNACVNTMGLYLAGKRLVFRDANGEEVDRAAAYWNSLHAEEGEAHWRKAICKDIALLGDCSTEVLLARGGGFAAVYHLDAMRLRVGKKDETGRINHYYWSSNWEKHPKDKLKYPVTELPVFGTPGMRSEGKGVIYMREYHQGEDYYGLPFYLPALTDAEVWASIAPFNRTQLQTGFRPAFHIHVVTNADPENAEELDASMEEIFTGFESRAYAITTGTKDEAPIITKLERGDHAGELDKMADRHAHVIYKACGIPPILMGDEVNTGLSGKGLALEQSITQFIRTQVQPRQYLMTDIAKRLVQLAGFADVVEVEVEQLSPFDAATDAALNRQSYLRRTLVWEDRAANGLGPITTDGQEPREDRSNWDERNFLTLIEMKAGGGDGMDAETPDTDNDNA